MVFTKRLREGIRRSEINGVAISVTVHDDSGSPIPVPATIALLLGLTDNLHRLKPLSDPQDVNRAT